MRGRHAFVFALLWFSIFFAYRDGYFGLPEGDQHWFSREREFDSNDWQFFLDSLAYNRTREIRPGNAQFLFRPLTNGLSALQDIFLLSHPFVNGVLTISWHVLVCFALYLLLLEWVALLPAACFALLFGLQISGVEMVLWRLISPYLFSILFCLLGWRLIIKYSKGSKRGWALFFFFLAALSHESVAISLAVLSIGLSVLALVQRQDLRGMLRHLWIGIPALAYFAISFVDYGLRKVPPVSLIAKGTHPSQVIDSLLNVMGSLLAAVLPLPIHFRPGGFYEERKRIFFSPVLADSTWVLGWVAIGLLVGVGYFTYKNLGKNLGDPKKQFSLYALIHLGVIVLLLCLSRGSDIAHEYLLNSSYYFYFTNCLILLVGVSLLSYRGLLNGRLTVIAIVLLCLFHYGLLRKRMKLNQGSVHLLARTIDSIREKVHHAPYCYAGHLDSNEANYALLTAGFRDSCTVKAGQPLLSLWKDGKVRFIELTPLDWVPVSGLLRGERAPQGIGPRQGWRWVSEKSFVTDGLRVKLTGLGVGGLVLGYRGETEFITVMANADRIVVLKNGGGERKVTDDNFVAGNEKGILLEVRKLGSDYYVLRNGVLWHSLDIGPSLEGRIGVYDTGRSPESIEFTDFAVAMGKFPQHLGE